MPTLTTNFRFTLPDYGTTGWDEAMKSNLQSIDAILGQFNTNIQLQGMWLNSNSYAAGVSVVDSVTGHIWVCGTTHTSSASPVTFATDRTNNPTYWTDITNPAIPAAAFAVAAGQSAANASAYSITSLGGATAASASATSATASATAASASATSASASAASAAASATMTLWRNRAYNGNFALNQRAYVTATALAAFAYAHDRWRAGAGGCTYTFVQAFPDTTLTITAGTLQQVVESINVEGGTYTLSWAGTAQGRINAGAYAASPITVVGLAAGVNITIEFNAGTVGLVMLNPSNAAFLFERRPYTIERFMCRRYYKFMSNKRFTGYAAGVGSVAVPSLEFDTMRIIPAGTASNITYFAVSALILTPAATDTMWVTMTATATGNVSVTCDLALDAEI